MIKFYESDNSLASLKSA